MLMITKSVFTRQSLVPNEVCPYKARIIFTGEWRSPSSELSLLGLSLLGKGLIIMKIFTYKGHLDHEDRRRHTRTYATWRIVNKDRSSSWKLTFTIKGGFQDYCKISKKIESSPLERNTTIKDVVKSL